MISIEQLRKIDPINLGSLSDEDLDIVRAKLYELGQFAFDEWIKKRNRPKAVPTHPVWLSPSTSGSCRI